MLEERIGSIGSNLITLPRTERGEREEGGAWEASRRPNGAERKKKEFIMVLLSPLF